LPQDLYWPRATNHHLVVAPAVVTGMCFLKKISLLRVKHGQ